MLIRVVIVLFGWYGTFNFLYDLAFNSGQICSKSLGHGLVNKLGVYASLQDHRILAKSLIALSYICAMHTLGGAL